MFSLVKLQKLVDFEINVGQMHCDGKIYCIGWSEEVMYLLILFGVFFCPVVIIYFYIYPLANTCRWAGVSVTL